MICPKCGNECDDDQMFCNKCGTKLSSYSGTVYQREEDDDNRENTFENITVANTPEEEEEVTRYLQRDLNANTGDSTEKIRRDLLSDEDLVDDASQIKRKRSNTGNSKNVERKYNSDGYDHSDSTKKKGKKGRKVVLVVLLTIVLVAAAVFGTLAYKQSSMTKKFDRYYAQGNTYYDAENYKDARTQYINAASNAFTNEQKIQAYEMVYKTDELIGGYDEEEISYLEALIKLDDSNIDYYKALIVLYQNNDMDSKIDSLISSAPKNLQDELNNYDGTIPVASVKEGTYDKSIQVELSATDDVIIYYTTDGSSAEDSSTRAQYTSAISLKEEGSYTIRAISIDENGKSSKEMTVKYVLDFTEVDPPAVTPESGTYTSQEKIKVTADKGCTIYYTTDGTTPTTSSKVYKKAIKMPKGDSLYYFIAVDADGVESTVETRAYNYSPEYKYSYDQALGFLTSRLMSVGKLENKYGEFENGNIAYFEYNSITEIDGDYYYIVTCEIEDEDGANVSTAYYAISCDSGTCYRVTISGDSYNLKDLK